MFRNSSHLTLIICLLALIQPAFGFQEQKAVAPAVQSTDPSQVNTDNNSPSLQVDISPNNTSKKPEGTEVIIPGLGKLGMLPKMDFGLELLYGSKDEKQQIPQQFDDLNPSENLRIHGSVKHSF